MFCFEPVALCLNLLFASKNLPVFLCKVLQVVLVEVLITRCAENFLRQVTDNCCGSRKERGYSGCLLLLAFSVSFAISQDCVRSKIVTHENRMKVNTVYISLINIQQSHIWEI